MSKPKRKSQGLAKTYLATKYGKIIHGDSLHYLKTLDSRSVDLIMTSPPYGLTRPKEYGNVHCDEYSKWFMDFAVEFKRVLKPKGSLVIDLGGTWNEGKPTRSLYQFKLLIDLCDKLGFHLAQEFFWWNPSKLPSPAEWVTIKRVRVKDAVNYLWWLSPTPFPKSDNRRVLQPYSEAMLDLLESGAKERFRPSGHEVTNNFREDNGAAIPPNLLAIANTNSRSEYLKKCAAAKIKPHPARFPEELPEFFIRYLTEPGDLVIDPFGGSCVTGEVAERLKRNWICTELREEYLQGAALRFSDNPVIKKPSKSQFYSVPRLGTGWDFVDNNKSSSKIKETKKNNSRQKRSNPDKDL